MIFIVSGPGGVGKGTLVKELVKRDERLWLSRSWTTRKRRDHETAEAYEFVDDATFSEQIAKGGFLEWVEFLGNRYGTPMPSAPPGMDVLLEIELQGAQKVRALQPEAVLILIDAPSVEEQRKRLGRRGEDAARIEERVAFGRREMDNGRKVADEVVINDDLETAVETLAAIVAKHRSAHEDAEKI